MKYIRTIVITLCLGIQYAQWREYPIKTVILNNCTQEPCTMELPKIYNAAYDQYRNERIYQRIYTVLRWGTYKDGRNTEQGSHKWVDIATTKWTPVYSIGAGTVIRSQRDWYRGNLVVIDHWEVRSVYAHLDNIFIQPGLRVSTGQIIAEVGDSGNTSWPHLHFQIDKNNDGQIPRHFVNCPGTVTQIVNEGLCRNQMYVNTVDPIAFIENSKTKVSITPLSLWTNNWIFDWFLWWITQANKNLVFSVRQNEQKNNYITIESRTNNTTIFPEKVRFIWTPRKVTIRSNGTGIDILNIRDHKWDLIKQIPIVTTNQDLWITSQDIIDIFQ